MVAGCLRRVGRLEEALLQYREVYRGDMVLPGTPGHTEALRYLVQLSQECGLEEDAAKYGAEATRLERLQAAAVAAVEASGGNPGPLPPGTAMGRVTAQRPPTATSRSAALPAPPQPPATTQRRPSVSMHGAFPGIRAAHPLFSVDSRASSFS